MGVFCYKSEVLTKFFKYFYSKMQLVENIKDYFGRAKLNTLINQQTKRKVSFCNLNNAKSVGILFYIENESDFKRLLSFVKVLKGDYGVRNVSSLALYSENEEPFFLQSKLSFDFFLPSDLNWKREPLKPVCSTFVQEEFDLLIDLTEDFNIPLRNLLLKSKAKFKVGRYSEENQTFYDLMINAEGANFSEFTQESLRYLTMIHEK